MFLCQRGARIQPLAIRARLLILRVSWRAFLPTLYSREVIHRSKSLDHLLRRSRAHEKGPNRQPLALENASNLSTMIVWHVHSCILPSGKESVNNSVEFVICFALDACRSKIGIQGVKAAAFGSQRVNGASCPVSEKRTIDWRSCELLVVGLFVKFFDLLLRFA
jgi:hypothetical protein